ncbi:FG-GAP repeat protein [candidate division KSB1 bacterium]|nr:FG-GAP repeat protein [candidate division KSB1 bacterium]
MRNFLVFFMLFTLSTIFSQFDLQAQRIIDLSKEKGDLKVMGGATKDYLGRSIAAGDFNGDGIEDLLMGAYGADAGNTQAVGKVYVVLGSKNLLKQLDLKSQTADFTLTGHNADDLFGFNVAAGDLNGDKIDDIIVGAFGADPFNRKTAGQVYIIFGQPFLPKEQILSKDSADVTISGYMESAMFSVPIATGDLNGDGIQDLVIGSYDATVNSRQEGGAVFVFYGRTKWPANFANASAAADLIVMGANSGDKLGRGLACGDFDGDKIDDLMIGAYKTDPNSNVDAGTVYVMAGGTSLMRVTDLHFRQAMLTIDAKAAGGAFGVTIAAGDINHDNISDMIVGALWENSGTKLTAGKAYVFYGSQQYQSSKPVNKETTNANLIFAGANASDNLGIGLALGDFNGDSYDDVILGASYTLQSKNIRPGACYVFNGRADWQGTIDLATATPNLLIWGTQDKDNFGWVTLAADLNGDGTDDIAVGADLADPSNRADAGEVHAFIGNASPTSPALLSPIGGDYVASANPTLTWKISTDKNSDSVYYKIVIFRTDLNDSIFFDSYLSDLKLKRISAPDGQTIEFKPVLTPALKNGTTCRWTVQAFDGKDYSARPRLETFSIDLNSPKIEHDQILSTSAGQALQILAGISDEQSGVQTAELWYRQGGDTLFKKASMLFLGGNSYQSTIPAADVNLRGLEYCILATDFAGNPASRVPLKNYLSVQVQIEGAGIEYRFPRVNQPGVQAAYRLVSVPTKLTDPAVGTVLNDDLGTYDKYEWRLFDYQTDKYIENPEAGAFTPGKSYFMILKENGKKFDTGPTISFTLSTPYPVALNPGWNLIGNPFNFDLPLNHITLPDGTLPVLYNYQGEWKLPTAFQPWEGYALFNSKTVADTLWVNPSVFAANGLHKQQMLAEVLNKSVQIVATCGSARDGYNFFGMNEKAQNGPDEFDFPEPPPFGEFVSLYFLHPELQQTVSHYTTDIISDTVKTYIWQLAVYTNISARPVTLNFSGLEKLSDAYQIKLTDLSTHFTWDLENQSSMQLLNNSNSKPRHFSILLKRKQTTSADAKAVPLDFELGQNYPNPFYLDGTAGRTVIYYSLPRAETINLTIYNLLGKKVTELVPPQNFEPGRYVVEWRGQDLNGQQVSAGIYFYHLRIGNQIFTRKMVVMQ